ncbi:hypothetical protein B0H16DRAFT_1454183 [Mycena metata]|uniref:Uncharacterized protein n=1 Tax=Mycena metata TaxID=1033252 RepID=A0AAD7JL40_9AGAR|nr:hypothetical protein B0H16DRAFT_1454183 [Mycena metata]
MLPDGLSDLELRQSKLPMDNILTCKAALIRTSLAYQDKQKRLRVLVPIQEYMQQYYSPTPTLTNSLLSHFQELLKTYTETSESPEIVSRIIPNFANIQNLLSPGLKEGNLDLMKTISYTLALATLGQNTGWSNVSLVNQIPGLIYGLHSLKLELQWLTFSLGSYFHQPLSNPEAIISEGLAQISACNDQSVQVGFLQSVGHFYLEQENGMSHAQKFGQQALEFSAGNCNIKCQSSTSCHLALIHCRLGDYGVAIGYARPSRRLAQLAGVPRLEVRALHIEILCLNAIGNYALGISLCQTAYNLLKLCISDGLICQAIMNAQGTILTFKSEYIINLLNILSIDPNTDVAGNAVLQEINILQGIFSKLGQYQKWQKWFITMCAEFQLREGDFLLAETGFQRCLKLSWGSDEENIWISHRSKAECMLHLGEISQQRRDFPGALRLWEHTKPLFERSSQTRQLALVDEKISGIQPHLEADQQRLVLLSELHPPSEVTPNPNNQDGRVAGSERFATSLLKVYYNKKFMKQGSAYFCNSIRAIKNELCRGFRERFAKLDMLIIICRLRAALKLNEKISESDGNVPKWKSPMLTQHGLPWADILTVDLSRYETHREELVETVSLALERDGFFYVVGHSITQETMSCCPPNGNTIWPLIIV